jgi:hypothetical protein
MTVQKSSRCMSVSVQAGQALTSAQSLLLWWQRTLSGAISICYCAVGALQPGCIVMQAAHCSPCSRPKR